MSGSAPQRALYFRLGEYPLAVGGESLRQVVTVGRLTPVPRVGRELLGLFSVRGEVLPLIDLRPLVGLPTPEGEAAGRQAALLEHGGSRIALLLDDVLGFFPVAETFGAASPALAPFTRFLTAHDAVQAALLDLGPLMAALERRLVVV